MLKSLILFTLFFNITFAKDRFTEADKKRFIDEVKQEIAEHKVENKGRVDLQIIKPGFYAELEEYLQQEKFTRNEMLKIKQDYENLAKDSSITPDRAEEAFYNFINIKLNELNSKVLEKIKEGNICNNWSCEDQLKCAPDPVQVALGKLKKAGASCVESSECVSNECVEAKPGSKNKICEDVYRCFRPLSLGESCMINPVCGMGACLPYNSQTSGIGECSNLGLSCKKNNDCCSNSCANGKCQENYICKDCVSKGARPQRGQKCCEGLYQNERGVCVPDVPPSVIEQVFNAIGKTLLASAMASEESDTAFLKKTAEDDKLDIESGIMKNRKKYENGLLKPDQTAEVDKSNKPPATTFDRRSDFNTCNIYFRDDFYNALKKDGAFDLQMAMLGFDFVITGDSDKDYWTVAGRPDSSLYSRLKKIGLSNRELRAETNKKIAETNKRLTCMCLDVIGFNKIEDAKKKEFFSKECIEYDKHLDPKISFDDPNGDASGLKAKRLLVEWTNSLASLHASLSIDNTEASTDFLDVATWASSPEAKWSTSTTENFELFKFNIRNPSSSSVAGLGALVGVLLAAGAIAILGGFATTTMLSTWATAGIITASAATGAGGLWMIASLKGAWITQRPEITDNHVGPRSYSCGKKNSCMEYTRTLVQPYNEVCGIHTSSNACLKAFVVVNDNMQAGYIVDPWIPVGVSKEAILKNQPLYTEKIETAFKSAKSAMISKKPGATGGGGKKGGGTYISENYLSEIFIDEAIVGKYIPELGSDLESTYFMDSTKVKLIKEAAKAFAISEGVFEASETANLDAFADYAYEYHFILPKKSRSGEISYPTASLQTYLDFMANNVAAKMSKNFIDTAKDFLQLNEKYKDDYANTLKIYSSGIDIKDTAKSNLLAKAIEKEQKELDSLKTMNTILNNGALDTELSKLSSGFIAEQAKIAGANSLVLSTEQKSFLKAVGDLRLRRKAQLKSLANYNRAMVANGDADRTAKMAIVSKAFNDRFTNKAGSFSGSSLGQSSSSDTDSAKAQKDKNVENTNPSSAYANAMYGMGGSSYGSSSSGSGSRSFETTKNSSVSNGSTDESTLEAEGRVLTAIEARNRAKKDKYESKDGQTLFEKVTNAYIRNYDKVFTKRKDKDVIEENK